MGAAFQTNPVRHAHGRVQFGIKQFVEMVGEDVLQAEGSTIFEVVNEIAGCLGKNWFGFVDCRQEPRVLDMRA